MSETFRSGWTSNPIPILTDNNSNPSPLQINQSRDGAGAEYCINPKKKQDKNHHDHINIKPVNIGKVPIPVELLTLVGYLPHKQNHIQITSFNSSDDPSQKLDNIRDDPSPLPKRRVGCYDWIYA